MRGPPSSFNNRKVFTAFPLKELLEPNDVEIHSLFLDHEKRTLQYSVLDEEISLFRPSPEPPARRLVPV